MQWIRLSVPFISILAFLGCVGNFALLKAVAQKWRQGSLLCWLLFEILLVNLVYLVEQSTIINLHHLGVNLTSSAAAWILLDCVQLALRSSSYLLSLALAIERYLALRKAKVHNILNRCLGGVLVTLSILLATGIFVVLYLFLDCDGPVSGSASFRYTYPTKVTNILHFVIAFCLLTLAVHFTCSAKQGTLSVHPMRGTAATSPLADNFDTRATKCLTWFFLTMSLASLVVCLLNIMRCREAHCEIISAVAALLDVTGYSIAPFSLLLSNKRLLCSAIPKWLYGQAANKGELTNKNHTPIILLPRDGHLKESNLKWETEIPIFRKKGVAEKVSFRRNKQRSSLILRRQRHNRSLRDSDTSTLSSSRTISSSNSFRECSINTFRSSESSMKVSFQSSGSGFSFLGRLSVSQISENEDGAINIIGRDKRFCQKTSSNVIRQLSIVPPPLSIRVQSITTTPQSGEGTEHTVLLKAPRSLSLPLEPSVETFTFLDRPTLECWQGKGLVENEPPTKLMVIGEVQDMAKSFSPVRKKSDTVLVFSVVKQGSCRQVSSAEAGKGIVNLPGFIPSPSPNCRTKCKLSKSDSSTLVQIQEKKIPSQDVGM